jgi:hypothetical protein
MPSSAAPPMTSHPMRDSFDGPLLAAGFALTAFGVVVGVSVNVGAPTSSVGWTLVAVGSWVTAGCGRGLLVRRTWVGDGVGLGGAERGGDRVGVGVGVGLTGGSVMMGVGVGVADGVGLSAAAGPPVDRAATVTAASSAARRWAGSIHREYEASRTRAV